MAQNGPEQGQVVQIINCLHLGSPKNNGTSTGLLANLKSKSLQDHIQENAGRSQDHVHEDTQDMEGQTDVEVEIVI